MPLTIPPVPGSFGVNQCRNRLDRNQWPYWGSSPEQSTAVRSWLTETAPTGEAAAQFVVTATTNTQNGGCYIHTGGTNNVGAGRSLMRVSWWARLISKSAAAPDVYACPAVDARGDGPTLNPYLGAPADAAFPGSWTMLTASWQAISVDIAWTAPAATKAHLMKLNLKSVFNFPTGESWTVAVAAPSLRYGPSRDRLRVGGKGTL